MRAWRLEKAGGRFDWEEVPVPTPRAGAALVRMRAAPVLSYMGEVIAGRLPAYRFPPHPFTPGTNGVGEIEAVGPEVYHLKPGQRVVLNPHLVANEVIADPAQILIGLTSLTADFAVLQQDWPDGAFAEYALMPASVLTPIAADVRLPNERLATFGKFAVPYGGLSQIGLRAGESLIVNGASGYFGSAAVLLGVAMGATRVIAAGRDRAALEKVAAAAGRRAVAVALGGDAAKDIAALRDAAGGGADAAIDLVGRATDAGATLATLRALRRGGRLALMGSMTAPLTLSYGEVMINDWTIVGRFMYPRDTGARLVAMAAAGLLDIAAVNLRTHPLADLPVALDAAAKMRGLDAVVVTM